MGSIFDHVTKGRPKQGPENTPNKGGPGPKSLFDIITEKKAAQARKVQVSDDDGANTKEITEAQRIAVAEKMKAMILSSPVTAPGATAQQDQPKPLSKVIAEQVNGKFNIMMEGQKDVLLICGTEQQAITEGMDCADRLGAVWCGVKKAEVKEEQKEKCFNCNKDLGNKVITIQAGNWNGKFCSDECAKAYEDKHKDDVTSESNIPDDDEYRKLEFKVGEHVMVSATGEQAVTKGGKQWNEAEIKAMSSDKKSVQLYIPATGETRWINRFARPIKKIKEAGNPKRNPFTAAGDVLMQGKGVHYIVTVPGDENAVFDALYLDAAINKAKEKGPGAEVWKVLKNVRKERMYPTAQESKVNEKEDEPVIANIEDGIKKAEEENRAVTCRVKVKDGLYNRVRFYPNGRMDYIGKVGESRINESVKERLLVAIRNSEDVLNQIATDLGVEGEDLLNQVELVLDELNDEEIERLVDDYLTESKINEEELVKDDILKDVPKQYVFTIARDWQMMHKFRNTAPEDMTYGQWIQNMWDAEPEEKKRDWMAMEKPVKADEAKVIEGFNSVLTEESPVAATQGVKENPDEQTSKDPEPAPAPPAEPKNDSEQAPIAPKETNTKDDLVKEYIGSSSGSPDTVHYYMVKTDDGDLQLVDQEGQKKYSAKESGIDPNDRRAFVNWVVQNADVDDMTRPIILKYVMPEPEKPVEPEQEEKGEEEPEAKGAGGEKREELKAIKAEAEAENESKKIVESTVNEDEFDFMRDWHKAYEAWEEEILEAFEKKNALLFDKKHSRMTKIEVTENGEVFVHVKGDANPLIFKGYKTWGDYAKEHNIEESKSSKALIEMKVDDGTNEFDVQLVDEETLDTIITINGRRFAFSQEFAAMWRTADGELTEEGLREVALEALSTMDADEYQELTQKDAKVPDVEELPFARRPYNWWIVTLNGEEIDKIQYEKSYDAAAVKKSLVDHDGYDPNIEVKIEEKTKDAPKVDETVITDEEMITDDDLQVDIDEALDTGVNLDEKEMTSKKTGKKLKASAGVRNRGKVVFSAAKSKDKKDHFPINNAGQARNALARSHQYKSAPPWYSGSLSALQNAVKRAVKSAYPSIDAKESVNETNEPRMYIDSSRGADLLKRLLKR